MTTILKLRQANVSQHLMVLREMGLVRNRRDDVLIYYSLADERTAQVLGLMRKVLGSTGVKTNHPSIPALPVKGCPCPRCDEAASFGR